MAPDYPSLRQAPSDYPKSICCSARSSKSGLVLNRAFIGCKRQGRSGPPRADWARRARAFCLVEAPVRLPLRSRRVVAGSPQSLPLIRAAIDQGEILTAHGFELGGAQNRIEHLLTKPHHPSG
jgi:hypothetical protein